MYQMLTPEDLAAYEAAKAAEEQRLIETRERIERERQARLDAAKPKPKVRLPHAFGNRKSRRKVQGDIRRFQRKLH